MPQRVGAATVTSQQPRWRLHQILSTWNFWAIAVAIAAITAISQAIVVTIVPYATELGFLPGSVALLITAFSISAAIVKVVSGILAEYIDQRIIMFASALAMIASLLLLLIFFRLFDACHRMLPCRKLRWAAFFLRLPCSSRPASVRLPLERSWVRFMSGSEFRRSRLCASPGRFLTA